MKKSRIHISIGFGDIILPVIECEDGHKRVPLQPIAKEIGLNWQAQTRKLQPESFKWRQLGLEKLSLKATKTDSIHIRVDKVIAFMHGLNPDMVRSQGQNSDTADWLEKKIIEWDEAVYAYDKGFSLENKSSTNELSKLFSARDKANPQEKVALTALIADTLSQMGYPVEAPEQKELPLT